jgi:murein L,D-transpeptidase YcbB/YkuD
VNQLRIRSGTRWMAALVIAALLCRVSAMAQSGSVAAPGLNGEDQAWLHQAVDSGNSSDLRWPNFADYSQHLKKFYGFNGYSLWWVKNGEPTAQAMQVIAVLRQAEVKGLSAEDYDGSRWDARLAKLKPATRQPVETDAVKFDLDLTVCVMRYISDLHIGKVNPKHLDFAFDEESKKYDLPEFLRDRAVNGADVVGALATVEPPYPGYRRTIQALQAYLQLAKKDGGEQLPAVKKPVVPGDTYAGVPRLAQLLRLVGDLPQNGDVSVDPPVYKGALVDAVKRFQGRMGRDVTGHIDAQTVADLNVSLSSRVRQMQLTLERWRWLPESYQNAPIIANIPEFRLRAYDKNFNIGVTMNVVVGKAYGHGTPVFSENMQYVVFRPYWEVPYSITKAEIVPHILRDPGYLARENLEIVDSKQNVVASAAVSSDVIGQLRAGKLFVRQKPGPKNSLGLVKFLFPNSYNVYMHDTPATQLFSRSRRDFSHGCVRLGKPDELAAWVLHDNPGWTPERIHDAMNGTTTQQVNLAHPIPVLIVYATVIVLEDGQVHFYDDIYHHDAELEKALAQGYPYPW